MTEDDSTFSKENIIPAAGSGVGILLGAPFGIVGGMAGALGGYGVGKAIVMAMGDGEEVDASGPAWQTEQESED